MHLLISLDEVSPALGVLGIVPRGDDFFSVAAQDFEHRLFVVTLRRRDQRLTGILRRRKRLLAWLLSLGERRKTNRQEHCDRGDSRKIVLVKFIEIQACAPHIASPFS